MISTSAISSSSGPEIRCAALAVVPRQDQCHDKAQHQQAEHDVHGAVGPVIAAGNHVEHLDQRERERAVGDRPLHQLALPQALPEIVHPVPPQHRAAMMPEFVPHGAGERVRA
ncbi:MAG TPA: hypothetical protein VFH71_04505 [Rhodanobacteraceae bacterium]|nr:hypothetical protein [Rhodanobacteraceae bacterium]